MSKIKLAKIKDVHALKKGSRRADAREDAARFEEPNLLNMLSLSEWRLFVPETLVLLAVIAGLEFWLGRSLGGTGGLPHAYWLPILLASAQYGVVAGMLASLATIGCYVAFGLPAQSAAQSFYDYAAVVAAQPAAWLAAALVLGGLRSLHIHQQAELQTKLNTAQQTAMDLADGLERAADEIGQLERSIAYENGSVGSLVRSFSRLDLTDRASVVASFCELIRYGVGAKTFAIYLRQGKQYRPVVAIEDDVAIPSAALATLDGAVIEAAASRARSVDASVIGIGTSECCLLGRVADSTSGTVEGVIVCLRLDSMVEMDRAQRRLMSLGLALHSILRAVENNGETGVPGKRDSDQLAKPDEVVLAKAVGDVS